MINIQLPFPPTLNTYYRHVGARVLISRKGRIYRTRVKCEIIKAGNPRIEGDITCVIEACPPDRRKRDLDNLLKATFDSMEHANLFENDNQIKDLRIYWGPKIKGGLLNIELSPTLELYPSAI